MPGPAAGDTRARKRAAPEGIVRFEEQVDAEITVARLPAGEDPDEAFSMARDVDEVIAVGVNCTDPTEIVELVERAAAVSGKPVVAYPNSGEGWDAVRRVWVGGSTFVPERVTAWVDGGARLVGGCCRVGPDQIAELRAQALSVAPARRPD